MPGTYRFIDENRIKLQRAGLGDLDPDPKVLHVSFSGGELISLTFPGGLVMKTHRIK